MQLPKPPASGAFVKFADKGDSVTGHVLEIRGDGQTMGGEACPLLVLDTGDEQVKVTCSQAQLWSKTVTAVEAGELAVGKRVRITLSDVERRPNGHTLKHFEIKVAEADPAFVASAAASAPEPF